MTVATVIRELGYVLQRKNSIKNGEVTINLHEVQRWVKMLEDVQAAITNSDKL